MREHPYYKAFCMLHNEIRRDPQHRWSIDEISNKMNLSRSYVQHLYKRFFQISILSDIKKSRIEHAKYLLSATDETVCSIAQTCGYDNDVHFMRTFKKETNMTPSQFREKISDISNRDRPIQSKTTVFFQLEKPSFTKW